MALTPSGAISLNDINTSTGKASGTQITMNGTAARCISGANTGAVSMNAMRGKTVAGGTIIPGSRTTTSKGVTTITYGYISGISSTSQPTLGNLATIFPTASNWNNMYAAKSSNQSFYGGAFTIQTSTSSAVGYNINFRARVGNTVNTDINYSTFVQPGGGIGLAIYGAPNGSAAYSQYWISPSDVGVTRDWVICQI